MTPTAYTASAYVEREARKLLQGRQAWAWVRNQETGAAFVAVPSGSRVYQVHPFGASCTCEATQVWNAPTCKHRRAVVLANQEDELAAMLAAISSPRCPDGPPEPPAPSLSEMRILFPGCAGGCGNLADDGRQFCSECAAVRERSQRMAAARAAVLRAFTTEGAE